MKAAAKVYEEDGKTFLKEGTIWVKLPGFYREEWSDSKMEAWKEGRTLWEFQPLNGGRHVIITHYDGAMSTNKSPLIYFPSDGHCVITPFEGRFANRSYSGPVKLESDKAEVEGEPAWLFVNEQNSWIAKYYVSQKSGFLLREKHLSKPGAIGKALNPVIQYSITEVNPELTGDYFDYKPMSGDRVIEQTDEKGRRTQKEYTVD